MTKALYLDNSYLAEFDAIVLESEKNTVVLDQTCFYPNSGGQPHDLGVLHADSNVYKVVNVHKTGSKIFHELDKQGLKKGDKVTGAIDWPRRFLFMRSHTASHVLSAVIHDATGAKITGNQIAVEKVRVDFNLENFDREQIKVFEQKANQIISENNPVEIVYLPREEAMKLPAIVKLNMAFPEHIDTVRIVDILGFDQQACAGTHVNNTSEIVGVEIIKAENKGKNNRRIYFRLK